MSDHPGNAMPSLSKQGKLRSGGRQLTMADFFIPRYDNWKPAFLVMGLIWPMKSQMRDAYFEGKRNGTWAETLVVFEVQEDAGVDGVGIADDPGTPLRGILPEPGAAPQGADRTPDPTEGGWPFPNRSNARPHRRWLAVLQPKVAGRSPTEGGWPFPNRYVPYFESAEQGIRRFVEEPAAVILDEEPHDSRYADEEK